MHDAGQGHQASSGSNGVHREQGSTGRRKGAERVSQVRLFDIKLQVAMRLESEVVSGRRAAHGMSCLAWPALETKPPVQQEASVLAERRCVWVQVPKGPGFGGSSAGAPRDGWRGRRALRRAARVLSCPPAPAVSVAKDGVRRPGNDDVTDGGHDGGNARQADANLHRPEQRVEAGVHSVQPPPGVWGWAGLGEGRVSDRCRATHPGEPTRRHGGPPGPGSFPGGCRRKASRPAFHTPASDTRSPGVAGGTAHGTPFPPSDPRSRPARTTCGWGRRRRGGRS